MKSTRRTEFATIDVRKLGRAEWRVSEAGNPDHVLGYIERQRAGRFEVVWMTDPMSWGYSDTFDSAIVAFVDSVRFTGDVFPKRAKVVGRGASATLLGQPVTHIHRATWIKHTGRSSVA